LRRNQEEDQKVEEPFHMQGHPLGPQLAIPARRGQKPAA
jgi:hypothetical protein